MKTVLKYLNSYKKESVLSPLFKLFEAALELLIPLIVASIIDDGIKSGDIKFILRHTAFMALLGLFGFICAATAQFFSAKAAIGFGTTLRKALFCHIQKFSYTDLDSFGTSSLITNITSDLNQLQTGVNLVLRLFLRSPIVVIGAMIMALSINVRAALPFVVMIPSLCIVVFGIMLISIPLYRKVQERLGKVLAITRENLSGVRVIRAFNLEKNEIGSFESENEKYSSAQRFVGRVSALMNPLTYVIVNVAVIFLIRGGAIRVNDGTITQGQLVAMYNYMTQILVELIKLANLIITVTKSVACGKRIAGVLETCPEATSEQTAEPIKENEKNAAICFENVTLKYRGAGEASLSGISFSVQPGQTLGIIGATGSGKTSLVNLIAGFYPPTEGKVTVFGQNIRTIPKEELNNKIGIVPQKAVLFRGTVLSNLRWGNPDASEADCTEALSAAQALDFVMEKGGLECNVEAKGTNFSGGQRQRLTIARALVKRPAILILDDSASALDYATEAGLRASLRSLPYKPTTILVSSRTSALHHANQIIVLDNGKIAGIGTHEELLDNCLIYREIHNSRLSQDKRRDNA